MRVFVCYDRYSDWKCSNSNIFYGLDPSSISQVTLHGIQQDDSVQSVSHITDGG